MQEIIGVRFKTVGKIYYFAPGPLKVEAGEYVIVETSRGVEIGLTVIPNKEIEDDQVVSPLKEVIRIATPEDLQRAEENREKEKKAFRICEEKIAQHGLDMKLVDVEYTFDENKILFYFTSDGRVDFRELVKELASVFRTRIELRQIGVRDEAKMKGGLGVCGRPFCCSSFLNDFQPVSIKMAKEQYLSLNPVKISGTCGRLMCCLKYEHETYEQLLRTTPRTGALVETPAGIGTVSEVSLLTGNLTVTLQKAPETPKQFHKSEVRLLKDGVSRSVSDDPSLKNLEDK
ncbi:MAG: stage 0 sporulation family protein [Clostridia bacterium]|nr:stage 0 sporulation family protein [Clostridia bacterium]MBR5742374.1 stage 0 sporulation family protein [Clostridia bacterium]